eukprot:1238751-Prymnesium_polylepis.1
MVAAAHVLCALSLRMGEHAILPPSPQASDQIETMTSHIRRPLWSGCMTRNRPASARQSSSETPAVAVARANSEPPADEGCAWRNESM